jgi:YidC/Oxa1 family membrane protein insertase
MFQLFANVLAWCYSVTHNYALAIALFTLIIMVLVTPLTLKSTKSMLEMQRLQPEVKRLQNEYKGDRQKLNEELMKLYQEHKVNPLSGCLPLLLQAPVFIILYRVLSKISQVGEDGTFDPAYISETSELYKSLDGQTQMMSFGLDLSESAVDALGQGFVQGLPYLVLVLLVMATSYYQQYQITARNKYNPNATVNAPQQLIMKALPLFFGFISLTLPSGLIIYFLTSNLYRIGLQAYITRRYYRKHHWTDSAAEASAAPGEPKAKPGATGATGATNAKRPAPSRPATPKPAPSRVTPPKGSTNDKSAPRPHPRPQPKKPKS